MHFRYNSMLLISNVRYKKASYFVIFCKFNRKTCRKKLYLPSIYSLNTHITLNNKKKKKKNWIEILSFINAAKQKHLLYKLKHLLRKWENRLLFEWQLFHISCGSISLNSNVPVHKGQSYNMISVVGTFLRRRHAYTKRTDSLVEQASSLRRSDRMLRTCLPSGNIVLASCL